MRLPHVRRVAAPASCLLLVLSRSVEGIRISTIHPLSSVVLSPQTELFIGWSNEEGPVALMLNHVVDKSSSEFHIADNITAASYKFLIPNLLPGVVTFTIDDGKGQNTSAEYTLAAASNSGRPSTTSSTPTASPSTTPTAASSTGHGVDVGTADDGFIRISKSVAIGLGVIAGIGGLILFVFLGLIVWRLWKPHLNHPPPPPALPTTEPSAASTVEALQPPPLPVDDLPKTPEFAASPIMSDAVVAMTPRHQMGGDWYMLRTPTGGTAGSDGQLPMGLVSPVSIHMSELPAPPGPYELGNEAAAAAYQQATFQLSTEAAYTPVNEARYSWVPGQDGYVERPPGARV